jgi:hypothetical protein
VLGRSPWLKQMLMRRLVVPVVEMMMMTLKASNVDVFDNASGEHIPYCVYKRKKLQYTTQTYSHPSLSTTNCVFAINNFSSFKTT